MSSDLLNGPRFNRIAYTLILLIVAAHVAVGLVNDRDPWHDEALLAANLIGVDFPLLTPMPYFEQAAPVGYVALARAVQALAPAADPIALFRLLDVAVFLVGLVALLLHALRTCRPVDFLMLAGIALSSGYLWTYASEIKHYGFEFTATAFLLITGRALAYSDRPAAYVQFGAAILVAAAISFTTPIVVAAVLGGTIALRLLGPVAPALAARLAPPPPLRGGSAGLIVATVLALGVAAGMHLMVNRDLTQYQMAAYSFVYQAGTFDLSGSIVENVRIALRLNSMLLEPIGAAALQGTLQALGGKLATALTILGATLAMGFFLAAAARRAPHAVLTMLAFITGALLLNIMGQLPFVSTRHFFFIAPVTLIVLSVGSGELLTLAGARMSPGLRRAGAFAVLAALVWTSANATLAAANKRSQELTPLFAEIVARDPGAPVWVYADAQPAAKLLAPVGVRLVGMFDDRSGTEGWGARGGGMLIDPEAENPWQPNPAYPRSIGAAAAGASALWLIFAGDWMEPGREGFLNAADAAVGPCELRLTSTDSALYYCAPRSTGRTAQR